MEDDLNLCTRCNLFDVRALLMAAEAQKPREKNQNNKDGLPKFFEHVSNLRSLRDSALTCDMCKAIWQEYCKKRGGGEPDDDVLQDDLSMQSIWIGSAPYTSGLHGLPHVVVTQYASSGQSRILAYFEVYSERGREPPDNAHLLASSIFDNSGSPEALAQCRKWLQNCREQHYDCKKLSVKSPVHLPTRVLEVDAKDAQGNPRPRLVDGENRPEAFTALSYCWGGESLLILTSKTEAEMRSGLAMERFPATLREAVVITQNLGIKYLWIDALCIQQDSPEDWAREAAKMRDVYKGAAVTIAAASSAKSSDKIFRERAPSSAYCKIPWKNGDSILPRVVIRSGSEIWDDPTQSSSMHTRGWVLQETLLAPRTLYFGTQLLTFECATGQIDEAGRSLRATENYRSKSFMQTMYADISLKSIYKAFRIVGIPHVVKFRYPSIPRILGNTRNNEQYHLQGSAKLKQYLGAQTFFMQGLLQTPGGEYFTYYDFWREIIMEFSTRQLTKPIDTLPALSGLADDFHHVTGDEYVAGMWKGDVMRCLCFTLGSRRSSNRDSVVDYLAPSWSWASLQCGHRVIFNGGASTELIDFRSIATVVDIKATPAGEDTFGKVKDGQLTLKTLVLSIPNPQAPAPADFAAPGLFDQIRRDSSIEREYQMKHLPHDGQKFLLAKLALHKTTVQNHMGEALLLESVEDGRWRRVGSISVLTAAVMRDTMGLDEREVVIASEWKKAAWKKETIRIV